MSRVTRAAAHLSVDAVKAKLQFAPNLTQRRRWLIIYNALVDPRLASSIALHTGVSVATVRLVISTYNRLGPTALETPGKGGRRHAYLTIAQEQAFLAPFFDRATRGEIVTTTEIQQALEAHLGHVVHQSSVYRLLERHHWRKLVPRPSHPQADPDAQAAFKKTLRPRSPQPTLRVLQTITGRSC
jgi:transposase